MFRGAPAALVYGQLVAAGLTLQVGIQNLHLWLGNRANRLLLWQACAGASLAGVLITNTWLFVASRQDAATVVTVRSVFLLMAPIVHVPTLAALVGRRIPRWGVALYALLATLRLGLWLGTDLVFAHRFDAHGIPVYGPWLDVVTLPLMALVVVLIARLAWQCQRGERVILLVALGAGVAVVGLSLVTTAVMAELLSAYWVVPWAVGLQAIELRRLAASDAAERSAIADRAAAAGEIADSERRARLALWAGAMGSFEYDPVTRVVQISPELEGILGFRPGGAPTTIDTLLQYIHRDERVEFHAATVLPEPWEDCGAQLRWLRSDGIEVWLELSARCVGDSHDTMRVYGVIRDVTVRRAEEAARAHHATHDPLTGLANRAKLTSVLCERLRSDRPFSLLLMDLDGFRHVNDTLGHNVGDKLLVAVARRLRSCVRGSEVFARLGGDEFAVVMDDSAEAASRLATQLLATLHEPFRIDGVAIPVRASIGVARAPDDGDDEDTLLRRADAAMYRGKAQGSAPHVCVSEADDPHAERLLLLAGNLPAAIAGDEVEVHYQPTIDLSSGRSRTVEALVRWRHPELGMVSPVEFVPLAERYGLGLALTRRVLRDALSQCHTWRRHGLVSSVAVNASPHTLIDPQLVVEVVDALAEAGLPGEALILEITEDAFAQETPALHAALHAISVLGVRLAIDDYGAGYSSLGYLGRLPVGAIKLDRAFTSDLGGRGPNDAIVASTIELAHRLGLVVVAEGVESVDVLETLRGYGCDSAQGFGICQPADAETITQWLTRQMRPVVPRPLG